MLWISKFAIGNSYVLTILQYSFESVSVEETILEFDLNNNWFVMYFQRGNKFGLWRSSQITTEFVISSLVGVGTAGRTNRLVLRGAKHSRQQRKTLIHISTHSSVCSPAVNVFSGSNPASTSPINVPPQPSPSVTWDFAFYPLTIPLGWLSHRTIQPVCLSAHFVLFDPDSKSIANIRMRPHD